MVLSGVLFYFAYSYAFYAIVAEFTFLYLLHLPIFGLSVIGLFLVLLHLFQKNIQITAPKRSVKIAVIIFLLLVSAMLSYIWLSDILAHLTIPGHRSDMPDGKPPLIIYSLDLGIVIPLMFTAVVGLWRKRQFGYRLMGVMLTKAATMGFALMGMAISMHVQQLNLDIFLIYLWFFIGITSLIMTVIYLKNLVLAS